MTLPVVFLIGVAVGYIARHRGFCIFGSILELITLRSGRRMAAVISAMLVFGLTQMGSYRHGGEHPGLVFLVGGVMQGAGYFLAMGCPLSLLVRIGEGSKFHFVVFAGFLAGVAIYTGALEGLVSSTLARVASGHVITLLDLFNDM